MDDETRRGGVECVLGERVNLNQRVADLLKMMKNTKQLATVRRLLKEIAVHLPGPLTPQKLTHVDTRSDESVQFTRQWYRSVLRLMLTSMPEDEMTRMFIHCGPAEETLPVLTESLRDMAPSRRRDTITRLLIDLLHSDAFLFSTLRPCFSAVSDTWQWQEEWLKPLSSLPDVVANALKHNLVLPLTPCVYLKTMAIVMAKCMFVLSEALKYGVDVKVAPLSTFLGHLMAKFSSVNLLDPLVQLVASLTADNFTARRIWCYLLRALDDRALDKVVSHCASWAQQPPIFQRLLPAAEFPLEERWRRVLCKKLLFLRSNNEERVARNVLRYLSTGQATLMSVTLDLFNVWSDNNALLLTSFEQHEFISKSIIIAMSLLDSQTLATVREEVHSLLVRGMHHHLESANPQVRLQAMVIAELCVPLVHPQIAPPNFHLDRKETYVSQLEALFHEREVECGEARPVSFEQLLGNLECGDVAQDQSLASRREEQIRSDVPRDPAARIASGNVVSTPEEIDSDDDLEAYDMSEDTVCRKCSSPHYVTDLMDMLGDVENDDEECERVLLALQVGERLIRDQLPRDQPCLTQQLLAILIDLHDKYSIADFRSMRFNCMVAAGVSHVDEAARFLTAHFYRTNYSIAQRLDLLHVISAIARELSCQRDTEVAGATGARCGAPEAPWRQVVEKRIEAKTRRFFSRVDRKGVVHCENRFTPFAGSFFFPLAEKWDRCFVFLDLVGQDFMVLSTLLCTLACIVHCTGPVGVVGRMSRSLFDIVRVLRFHRQASVRESTLVAFSQALLVTKSENLMSNYSLELTEWKDWLVEAMDEDSSSEVRSLAQNALSILNYALQSK